MHCENYKWYKMLTRDEQSKSSQELSLGFHGSHKHSSRSLQGTQNKVLNVFPKTAMKCNGSLREAMLKMVSHVVCLWCKLRYQLFFFGFFLVLFFLLCIFFLRKLVTALPTTFQSLPSSRRVRIVLFLSTLKSPRSNCRNQPPCGLYRCESTRTLSTPL